MKKRTAALILVLTLMVSVLAARTKDNPQPKKNQQQASTPSAADNQKQNIQAYIALLRSDVRQQKAEMMGAVMQLSAEDAAKFWPIYSEYDAELSKLNDLRVANIEEHYCPEKPAR
jgi:peptidoglycan hydrolase CwlO-like protein